MSYSVLQGFQGNAGQPGALANALTSLGTPSRSVLIGRNVFGYKTDYWVQDHSRHAIREFLRTEAMKFDVIHVHAITPFYTKRNVLFPMGTDLMALKLAGKRIIMHFRGSEIRLASVFEAMSPYNYVEEDPGGTFSKFSEPAQLDYLAMCRALADEIVVSDAELQSYVPDAKMLPRGMDMSLWQRPAVHNEYPKIVHAPSRPGVKGTPHVIKAIEELADEGLKFDFRLVHGISHQEAKTLYEQADIVVDQLRIGWYGVLATEAMALGKTVISYVRDDLVPTLGDELPLANANPDTIKATLRRLILDKPLRTEIANRGYEYCRQTHDINLVARQAQRYYNDVLNRPPRFDFDAYMHMNEKQEALSLGELQKVRDAGRKAAMREMTLEHRRISISSVTRAIDHAKREGWSSLARIVALKIGRR